MPLVLLKVIKLYILLILSSLLHLTHEVHIQDITHWVVVKREVFIFYCPFTLIIRLNVPRLRHFVTEETPSTFCNGTVIGYTLFGHMYINIWTFHYEDWPFHIHKVLNISENINIIHWNYTPLNVIKQLLHYMHQNNIGIITIAFKSTWGIVLMKLLGK